MVDAGTYTAGLYVGSDPVQTLPTINTYIISVLLDLIKL